MNNSPFSMGWLMAMFDLPVMTDKERKMASRFRNDLIDHGFLMIQFSVYARPCVNFEQLSKHLGVIQKMVPEAGNVRLLCIGLGEHVWHSALERETMRACHRADFVA